MKSFYLSIFIILITINPLVQSGPHFYLGNPTNDTQNELVESSLQLSKDSRLYEYFGSGYDMFTGNPLGETVDSGFRPRLVFDLTYTQNIKTADNLFTAPDQVTVINDMSCSFAATSSEYTGMSSYQKDLSVSVSLKLKRNTAGVKAAFSASAEYKQMKKAVEEENKVSIITQAKCLLYRASLMESAQISADFKQSVIQAYRRANFNSFIDDWGTHYAYQVTFGAQAIQRSFYTRKDVQEMESMGINVAASVSVKGYGAKVSLQAKMGYSSEQENKFSNAKSEIRESYMGLAPPDDGDARVWLANVKESNPVPVAFKLGEISDLFTLRNFGDVLNQTDLNTITNLFSQAVTLKAARLDYANDGDDALGKLVSQITTKVFKNCDNTPPNPNKVNTPLEKKDKIVVQDVIIYHSNTQVHHINFGLRDTSTGNVYRNNPIGVFPSGLTTSTFTVPSGTNIAEITVYSTTSAPFYIAGINFCLNTGICSFHYGGYTVKEDKITMDGSIIAFETGNSFASVSNQMDYIWSLSFTFYSATYTTISGFKQLKTNKVGTDVGEVFEDPDRPIIELKTRRIIIHADTTQIYGLQLVLSMGSVEITTDLFGRPFGTRSEFVFSADDIHFVSISLWARDSVTGIELVTKRRTVRYGFCDGTATANYPLTGFITGFYGYRGSSIKSVGIKYLSAL